MMSSVKDTLFYFLCCILSEAGTSVTKKRKNQAKYARTYRESQKRLKEEMAAELSQLKRENGELRDENNNLKGENDNLKKQIATMRKKLRAKNQNNSTLTVENQYLKRELDQHKNSQTVGQATYLLLSPLFSPTTPDLNTFISDHPESP